MGSYSIMLHTTSVISGVLLVGVGVLLMSGKLTEITQLAINTNISQWVVEMDERIRLMFGIR